MLLLLLSLLSFNVHADDSGLIFPVSKVTQHRTIYSSTNVTTGAFVQIIASTPFTATGLDIFDSSGQTLELAVGAPGSESIQFIIFPGGNGFVPIRIPKGSRVSLKALSATANSGEQDLNLYTNFYQVR